jgi:protein tyrosine/serine phosphatase
MKDWPTLVCVIGFLQLGSYNQAVAEQKDTRPLHWAQPISKPGLPNLFQVSDTLFRGAQPSKLGMQELQKMGIKTVINLRATHSDRSKLKGTSLRYEHIIFNTFHPELEDVVRFFKIVNDSVNQPVFVHCQHGADRTGMMVAAYRMVVQDWTKEDAIREMLEGGFGFHSIWENLIHYVRGLDVDRLKELTGLKRSKE